MIYKNVNGTQKLVTNIRKPKKWRRFEYLLSSGTLWIDTGINPRVKPRVVAILAMLNNADKDYWGNKSINGSAYYANFSAYKLTYYRYGSTTSQNVNYTVTQNSIHEWDVSNKVYVDGILKFTSANTYTYNASQSTIQIFKAARSSYYSTYRLYSFKLYDGDTLVRDFIPAQYNGEYGLWDLVLNKFYENKGTGTFTVGPEIGKPYEEIEKLKVPLVESGIINQYHLPDINVYTEPDGSKWIRIFHHNNPASKIFASTDSFTTYVYKDEDRWFNVALCDELSSWEFIIKQKLLSTDTTVYLYRWSQNKNPMVATFSEVTHANVTYNTDGYNTTSYGGLLKKNGSTYLCGNNGVNGNWWGAIGSWTNFNEGIPAWNGQTIKSGYIDLYVRIDNLPFKEIPVWVLKNALVQNGTAYINTGIIANDNTKIKVKAYSNCTGSFYFTGTRADATGVQIFSLSGSVNGSTVTASVNGSMTLVPNYTRVSTGLTFETELITNGDGTYSYYFKDLGSNYAFSLDSVNYNSISANTQNLFIFSNGYNIIDSTNKIYYYKIWLNNVLVRDFVPATMGGRPGLYDKLNHKMYFNANSSGNFTVE